MVLYLIKVTIHFIERHKKVIPSKRTNHASSGDNRISQTDEAKLDPFHHAKVGGVFSV